MKVIVVSGARSNAGKTHLAHALCDLLPRAERVKIGHHARKPDGDANFYPVGTTFSAIVSERCNPRFFTEGTILMITEVVNGNTPEM
jgi:hypothetical protein